MDRVAWCDPVPIEAPCAVCDNRDGNRLLLRSLHLEPPRGFFDVATCGACESAWYPDFGAAEAGYPDDHGLLADLSFQIFTRHYLELVGGLDWRVGLIERVRLDSFRSVLEVGCGAGVLLDYCRTAWGADVTGLEPSAYGAAGSQVLGLPILPARTDSIDLDGRQFDLVIATEVLEHVDDPVGFLADIRGLVRPGGVAILTTPSVDALRPDTPPGLLYAALSTGAHRFLLSSRQLDRMLQAAGFAWCHVEANSTTLMAFVADQPVEVSVHGDTRERSLRYHAARLAAPAGLDDRALLANRIDHFVLSHSLGLPGPGDAADTIRSELDRQFGIDLDHPDALVERMLATRTLVEYGHAAPFKLAELLYWLGHAELVEQPVRTARWAAAGVIAAHGIRIDPVNMFILDRVVAMSAAALAGREESPLTRCFAELIVEVPEVRHIAVATVPVRAPRLLRRAWRRLPRPVRRTIGRAIGRTSRTPQTAGK